MSSRLDIAIRWVALALALLACERPASEAPEVQLMVHGQESLTRSREPIEGVRGILVPSPHVAPSDGPGLRPSRAESYCFGTWSPHVQAPLRVELVAGAGDGHPTLPIVVSSPDVASGLHLHYGDAIEIRGAVVTATRGPPGCRPAAAGTAYGCVEGIPVCQWVEASEVHVLDCTSDYECQ